MAFYLFLYRLFLLVYATGIRIAALQNKKAGLWLQGRQNWQYRLAEQIREKFRPGQPVVWMHCASLGEFEQGRPLLEKLRAEYPAANFIVSFFSPSGYEVRKKYAGADVVCYLPMDGPTTAPRFLKIVKPSLVLWVKYEYWYYYLAAIHCQNIPLLLVSGIFRENQPFFKWYNGLHIKMLRCFTHLFLQNETSRQLAQTIVSTEKITLSGDTRFDRVAAIREHFQPVEKIESWLAGATKVMVCGSTWDEDEKELSHYIRQHPEVKFLLAPHNVNEEEVAEIQHLLPGAIRFTQLPATAISHILIIDTIGLLSRLYYYATVAYVGGGFGAGIHNVLEAAVWGKPVVHGPEYQKFAEAKDLVAAGGAFTAEDALQLEKLLDQLFIDKTLYEKAAAICKTYVQRHRGATDSIVQFIQANRLLTRS